MTSTRRLPALAVLRDGLQVVFLLLEGDVLLVVGVREVRGLGSVDLSSGVWFASSFVTLGVALAFAPQPMRSLLMLVTAWSIISGAEGAHDLRRGAMIWVLEEQDVLDCVEDESLLGADENLAATWRWSS